MPWIIPGALLFLVIAAGGATNAPPPVPASRAPAAGIAPSSFSAAAGVIEGVVRIRPVPPRRTASRYGSGAGAAARPVQPIPPVVYIEGALQGGAGVGPSSPEMAQEDTAFVPALLVVPTGTAVAFPNQDAFFHNVFSYSAAARFDLGRYPRGESKDVRFDEPGLVKVYCEVHESMRAAVLVVENAHWVRPDGEGRFRLEGVPAGKHTLVAWDADRGEKKMSVEVPASGVVRVEIEL